MDSETTGTARNEQNIYVRGFDRWQVPVTVDGVRVYLPQDNRLDFARFTTPDIAEIQISEGYVSVLDGPGGMGGLINLVSRKPTREIETDMRSQLDFGRDGSYEGILSSAYVGTKQQNYYAQVSGTWRDMKGWMLPESFGFTPDQGWGFRQGTGNVRLERERKGRLDAERHRRIFAQLPASGRRKGRALQRCRSAVDPKRLELAILEHAEPLFPVQHQAWRLLLRQDQSLLEQVRQRSCSGHNQWVPNQNTPAAFNSVYNDYALGAGVEAGTVIAGVDTVKTSLEYRLDAHNAWEQYYAFKGFKGCTPNVVCYTQPVTTTLEDTYSAAIENTYHPTPQIDLVQGSAMIGGTCAKRRT